MLLAGGGAAAGLHCEGKAELMILGYQAAMHAIAGM